MYSYVRVLRFYLTKLVCTGTSSEGRRRWACNYFFQLVFVLSSVIVVEFVSVFSILLKCVYLLSITYGYYFRRLLSRISIT